MRYATPPSSAVMNKVFFSKGESASRWLKWFMAACMVQGVSAQETVINHWFLVDTPRPSGIRIIPVFGGKDGKGVANYEELYADYLGPAEQDPALLAAQIAREEHMREQVFALVEKYVEQGKEPELAYELAWAEVYRRNFLPGYRAVGSSKLARLLAKIALANGELSGLTEEDIQWLVEALLETDDRLSGAEARRLLRNLAQQLKPYLLDNFLDVGNPDMQRNLEQRRNKEIMLRAEVYMRAGYDPYLAYKTAIAQVRRGQFVAVRHHIFTAPLGVGYYATMPQRLPAVQTGKKKAVTALTLGTGTMSASALVGATEQNSDAEESVSTASVPLVAPRPQFSQMEVGPYALAYTSTTSAAVLAEVNANYTVEDGTHTAIVVRSGGTTASSGRDGFTSYSTRRNTITLSGGSNIGNRSNISVLEVEEGGALYLQSRSNAYQGTVYVTDMGGSEKAVLGTYDTSTTNLTASGYTWNMGNLAGSGDVLLRAHNTGGTSYFVFNGTDTNNWFGGRLSMTANGGAVQLRMGDSRWQNTVVDFSVDDSAALPSFYDSTFNDASSVAIYLTGNSAVAGLDGGTATKAAVIHNGYSLTVGNESTETYTYSGRVNDALSLNKVGTNTQIFTNDINADAITVTEGRLEILGNLTMEGSEGIVVHSGATLRTAQAVTSSAIHLYGGATWDLGGQDYPLNHSDAQLYVYDASVSPITLTGEAGLTWAMPSTIHTIHTGNADVSSPILVVDGIELDVTHSLTFTGARGTYDVGDHLVVAEMVNGGKAIVKDSTDAAHVVIESISGDYEGILKMQDNYLVVEITGIRVPTLSVNSGQVIWVHRFENESGHIDGALEAYMPASFNSSSGTWSGTYHTNQVELSNLELYEGSKLYLRDGNMSGSTINFDRTSCVYDGNIRLVPTASSGDVVQIHAEGKTWSNWYLGGRVSGSGNLQLVAHGNNAYDTVFTFTQNVPDKEWMSGTISFLSPRGGPIQLNIGNIYNDIHGDGRWHNVVFDMSNPTPSQAGIFSTERDRAEAFVLGLEGDAHVAGIIGGNTGSYYSGVATNITEANKYYTLTVGTENDSDHYSFGGVLGSNTFYRGGNNAAYENGKTPLTSHEESLVLKKWGTNRQDFTGEAYLKRAEVESGTLGLLGTTVMENLVVLGGATVVTDGDFSTDFAHLRGGANWVPEGDLDSTATTFHLQNMKDAEGNMLPITLSGNSVSWITPSIVDIRDSGITSADYNTAWFSTEGVDLTFSEAFTVKGLEVQPGGLVAVATVADGTVTLPEGKIGVYGADGNVYEASMLYRQGTVWIQLEDTVWNPLPVDQEGFRWSGEEQNTTLPNHYGLVMGDIWRADGSAEQTGWHEQKYGDYAPGVFVNELGAIFADANEHGDDPVRRVLIMGEVAPGKILVTADNYSGQVGNNSEAQLKYGYVFTTLDGMEGTIVDGRNMPTSIEKTGDATLVLNTANSFSGGIDVQDGALYLATPDAAGLGAIRLHNDQRYITWRVQNSGTMVSSSQVGAELMVNYTHSTDTASAYRNPTVANDLYFYGNKEGQVTISYAPASYNAADGHDDFSDVPRHWRNLTLSGAIHGEGDLLLKGYTSSYTGYHDQSYVSSFTINDTTSKSGESTFAGTVRLHNSVNTSLLTSDKIAGRTAGSVQLRLTDKAMQYAEVDLTREHVAFVNGDTNRQTYANILVAHGEVALRGLTADFLGAAHVYTNYGTGEYTRTYNSNFSQEDEVWRVRTVTDSISTLHLGRTGDEATYVYSGAMGYAQSYTASQQAHIRYGDGFESGSAGDSFYNNGDSSYGKELLSVVKEGDSSQFIYQARLQDVSVYSGTLGFNTLELMGNLNLVDGSTLVLDARRIDGGGTQWNAGTSYATVNAGKTLTVYVREPEGGMAAEPGTAWVQGDIRLAAGAGLTFMLNNALPSTGYEHVLLDVAGTLSMYNDPENIRINFNGVDFSSVNFTDKTYYLAAADEISMLGSNLTNGNDSSSFSDRIITLGYGYFGLLDTYDSSNPAHPTYSTGRDYLIMTVTGDPRRTWQGLLTDPQTGKSVDAVWRVGGANTNGYDYHWKENTAFTNGQVVLFGNLYQPTEWTETSMLNSKQSTIVFNQEEYLRPGTITSGSELVIDELPIPYFSDETGYQKVEIEGVVAPVAVIINSEYLAADGETTLTDGTNYWFHGSGHIADIFGDEVTLTETELANLEKIGLTEEWKTTVQKMGTGTAVFSVENTYSGGTMLQGGRIVMQNDMALGSGKITITNGAALQGDFVDETTNGTVPDTYSGELMTTTTILNTIEVNEYVDPDDPSYQAGVDARLVNGYSSKLVLDKLVGESDTVVMLHGVSLCEEHSAEVSNGRDDMFRYAVYKVLDPSGFYGTVMMDGNLWKKESWKWDPTKPDMGMSETGGKVQLDIMSTAKSDDGADWTNATVDLSLVNGTERTVLALDVMADGEVCELNTVVGTGTNSSVVNMNSNAIGTLKLMGLRDAAYEGVFGFGDFQVTLDYISPDGSTDMAGSTQHHFGSAGNGALNVIKQGAGTTQKVREAWLHQLTVEGGTFWVNHALICHDIYSGSGERVFVGSEEGMDFTSAYALTVGKDGVLAMNSHLFEDDGTKRDALEGVQAGTVDGSNRPVAWVQLRDGATLSARKDWHTTKQIDIAPGAAVTINTHDYVVDPAIPEYLKENPELDAQYHHSHIIQLLGTLTGHNVTLTVKNEQESEGAAPEELGTAEYMGYAAVKDLNQISGTVNVLDNTVLQVLEEKTRDAALHVVVDGEEAAVQVVEAAQTQYVQNLSLGIAGGELLLGGEEKTSLGSGSSALREVDENLGSSTPVQVKVAARGTASRYGTMDNVNIDLSAAHATLGGSSAASSVAQDVVVTVIDDSATHTVHHTSLYTSLVELQEDCSVNLADTVLIDKNSAVLGLTAQEDATEFSEVVVPSLAAFAGIQPPNTETSGERGENVSVSSTTTVQLTVAPERRLYQEGGKAIYLAKAEQFAAVDVYGNGLTVQISDSLIWNAMQAGAEYIAIQVGGSGAGSFSGNGRFNFESDGSGEFTEQFAQNRKMYDNNGNDITDQWVSSKVVSDYVGTAVSQHMLYIVVPEPATVTLSLLALAALVSRRRRG